MNRNVVYSCLIMIALSFGFISADAQITTPDGYRIEPLTIDGGGGTVAAGDYSMTCSIGQPAAGSMGSLESDADVGFLHRINYHSYDFEYSPMGWTFIGTVPPYNPLTSGWSAGRIDLTPNGTNAFGYWASDFEVPLLPGKVFMLTSQVSTTVPNPQNVPVIRFRYTVYDYAQSGEYIMTSTTGQNEPTEAGINYKFFFRPAQEYFISDAPPALFAFDVYNFEASDTVGERISLEHMNIDVIDDSALGTASNTQTYTFDSNEEGWYSISPPPYNDPEPIFTYDAGALQIAATDYEHFQYGFWSQDNAIDVVPDKLYRITTTMRTNSPNNLWTPQFKVRGQMGDYQSAAGSIFYTAINPDIGLSQTNKDFYTYIVSPSHYTGNLITTFDLLNFDPNTVYGASVILDQCTIEEFSIPSP